MTLHHVFAVSPHKMQRTAEQTFHRLFFFFSFPLFRKIQIWGVHNGYFSCQQIIPPEDWISAVIPRSPYASWLLFGLRLSFIMINPDTMCQHHRWFSSSMQGAFTLGKIVTAYWSAADKPTRLIDRWHQVNCVIFHDIFKALIIVP